MARTFILRDTASDLTNAGAVFNVALLDTTGTAALLSSGSVAAGATATGSAFTEPAIPGTDGTSTGTFTVEVNVITSNNTISVNVRLNRVNSVGTVLASALGTPVLSSNPPALKTFTFNSPALGTWAAGDRLRIDYLFIRAAGVHGGASVDIQANTTDAEAVTPFAAAAANVGYGRITFAELEVPAAPGITGTLDGTLPSVTGALTGTVETAGVTGTLAGDLPTITGALTGDTTAEGAITGTLPAVTGALTGTLEVEGAAAGALPALTGAFTGDLDVTGAVTGTLPTVTGALTGTVSGADVGYGRILWAELETPPAVPIGPLTGTLPALTGALTGTSNAVSDLPAITGAFTGAVTAQGAIAGTLPTITGSFAGAVTAGDITGAIAGTLPTLTGAFTGAVTAGDITGILAGTLAAITGAFEGLGAPTELTDQAVWVETATPDRFTGTLRESPFAGDTATPDRFTGTIRLSPHAGTTARPNRIAGDTAAPDRWTGTIRPRYFHETTFFREGDIMALTFVPLGPFTLAEVPEAVVIRWLRTHADGTTSGLPLFGQAPAWTVTAYLAKPSGATVTRACEILDPATLTTEFPDAADLMVNGDDGWVRMPFAAADLDEITTATQYGIQLAATNGTLLLKTGDVWRPEVNAGPASAAVLV